MNTSKIPLFVSHVINQLEKAGFEAYLVGGCVRDTILGRTPKDWDITTNARPEQVQDVFKDLRTVYENNFGTVTVLNKPVLPKEIDETNIENVSRETFINEVTHETYEEVQITTYRSEGEYTDSRHPDQVSYETDIKKDLERRDFTINAIAYSLNGQFIDPFNGQKDIKDKIIRCVLNADTRLKEDALRMLRTVRFSTTLDFAVATETIEALIQNASLIKDISFERIRDEFVKIIESPRPAAGVDMLERFGLLTYIIPELEEGIGCDQMGEHIYDVYNHMLHALQHAADKNFSFEVRISALFHDIGKPRTRRFDALKAGGKGKYTFFGHEVVGAKMTKIILDRLKFARVTVTRVTSLVRNHMFFSDTEQITLSAVRRIIQKVGPEHIWELMKVRECDRVGMKKIEAPYRLRKYHAMIDEALRDPISVSQLTIDGKYLMEVLHVKAGPRMGWLLHALLEEVLENPELNTVEKLSERVTELEKLEDHELKTLGEKGKEKKEEVNEGEVKALHVKHGVKK